MIFLQIRKLIQDFHFNNNYQILLAIITNQMINFKILRNHNKRRNQKNQKSNHKTIRIRRRDKRKI